MSALIVLLQHQAAHMMVDGASQAWRDGKFVHGPAVSKLHCLPHLNAVIGSRGPYGVALGFAEAINSAGFSSFDEMRKGAAEHFENSKMVDAVAASQLPDAWRRTEIVVAGWSADGPRSFYLLREDSKWVTREPGSLTLAPSEPDLDSAIMAALPPYCANGPDHFEAERDLVTIMEVQRKAHQSQVGGIPTIGAFALLATVTQAGISSRIVKRWPYKMEAAL